jgi:hypothetical protein
VLTRRTRIRIAVAFCGVLVGAVTCRQPAPSPARFKPTSVLQTARVAAHGGQDLRLLVDEGDAESAADYARYIEQELGFPVDGALDDLLRFCGFEGLTARDLETRPPRQLMASFTGRLLASRFFAPKISDVSRIGGPAGSKDLGWRKLVRLAVPSNSRAARGGIASAYVLFNVFQPRAEIGSDPFEPCSQGLSRCSASNQVILVPQSVQTGRDALFWLVFENAATGGRRTDHLSATFDGGDVASRSGGIPLKKYFLPAACAQCHGGSAATAKLNYLDSDHWFDRTLAGNDFADLASSPNGVVFDGGKDTTSTQFAEAFEVLRRLNQEIRAQNAGVGGEDFLFRAVDRWLVVHAAGAGFADPIARALPPAAGQAGARRWQDTAEDRALLGQLNRFCFRCHSTVAYHVFDKEAVFKRRDVMARRVERGPLRPGGMPQDRTLEPGVSAELAAMLRRMQ